MLLRLEVTPELSQTTRKVKTEALIITIRGSQVIKLNINTATYEDKTSVGSNTICLLAVLIPAPQNFKLPYLLIYNQNFKASLCYFC